MSPGEAMIVALIVIIIIFVAISYGWYNFYGWKSFEFKTRNAVSWSSSTKKGIADLRFKKVIFSIKFPDESFQSKDVTNVLNGMATAYTGQPNKGTLTLDRPLNPFSFVIKGVNDKDTATDPSSKKWKKTTATLVGSVRTI